MSKKWWSRMDPPQRRKVVLAVLGALFITIPTVFTTWWYMFSSTPPYQWFRENGFPMNFPLFCIAVPMLIGFALLGSVFLSIRKENTSTPYLDHVHAQEPSVPLTSTPTDNPQPAVVAFDMLKELLREGETLIDRCYHGDDYPTRDEIEDYGNRTLKAVRVNTLKDVINLRDISVFQDSWDEMDVLRKKAELSDMGRLPDAIINVFDHVAFERLYGRVQRLRELIAKITGTDFDSVQMIQAPADIKPEVIRETGPRVVPPRHNAHPHESIIASVQEEVDRIETLCDRMEDDLNSYAEKHGEATMPNAYFIFCPVDRDVIRDCKEVHTPIFSRLAELLSEMNQCIANYNDRRNARTNNKILKYARQKIPTVLEEAKSSGLGGFR